MSHILLVDASGFIHRAFHGGSGRAYRSDGLPTWGITGFMSLLWRLLGAAQADPASHAAAVFDTGRPTFRHEIFPAYKNHRPARAVELAAQMPYMRHAAETMGFKTVECEGFEADDVIATLAKRASDSGMRATIVSSDKDFHQLAGPLVEIVNPVAHLRLTAANVERGLFGVPPALVPDVQALAGDSVDNIPGLDGIGLKSAAGLIRLFRNVEGCVSGAHDRTKAHLIAPGQRLALKERGALERLQLYRHLATLVIDVPIGVGLADLELGPVVRDHVLTILDTLEARGRFEAIFAGTPNLDRVVEAVSAGESLEWWTEELEVPGQPVPDLPQCGFYERRMVRDGIFVPSRIWREDEVEPLTGELTGRQILRCSIGNQLADPVLQWASLSRHPIRQQKYEFEMADMAWAREYAPDDPKAKPIKPVDFYNLKPPTFTKPDSKKRKTA